MTGPTMTHAALFRMNQFEYVHEREEERIRCCHRPVRSLGTSFHADVHWDVYACDACQVRIFAVGGAHWWNYETPLAEAAR